MNWQPIETAPKDLKIIVWLADEGFPVMATYRMLDQGKDEEWEGFWLWEMDYGQDFHDITHWMHLPPPPETE